MPFRGRGQGQMGMMGGWNNRGGPRGGFGGPRRGMNPAGPYPTARSANVERKQSRQYLEKVRKDMPRIDEEITLYCPACRFNSKNNTEYLTHTKSYTHKNQMDLLETMPAQVKKEVMDLVNKTLKMRKTLRDLRHCDTCDLELDIPYSAHKNMDIHKVRAQAVKAGCPLCNVKDFKNFPAFRAHCKTDEHIAKAESYTEEFEEMMAKCATADDVPPHKEGIVFGKDKVKAADGWYCSVCRRFFYDEREAMAHKAHKSHYNHVRDLYFNKKNLETVDMGEYPEPKGLPITDFVKLEEL